MIIVRLLSPGPWLVGTTKVYSGVGADIVMESITLIDRRDASQGETSEVGRTEKFENRLLGPTVARADHFQSSLLISGICKNSAKTTSSAPSSQAASQYNQGPLDASIEVFPSCDFLASIGTNHVEDLSESPLSLP